MDCHGFQTIGGVIVVVEKTSEAEELEELCNGAGDRPPVARAISAPNDYNLSQGKWTCCEDSNI